MTEEFNTYDYEDVKARRHARFTPEERANYEKAKLELPKRIQEEESASDDQTDHNPAD